ncbi:hypothetical protein GUJ93_ZPchr0009g330 [Zizania palustris]|uniref:Retrotransposon gag domain-containing protein n=1 Tax=Zizania palustris TaxID=103762 RepID=A0A8J5S215_ZIZPA|nr:hypothetical protein GUJ93_ZPchr0009g330 [Zizania palustris]
MPGGHPPEAWMPKEASLRPPEPSRATRVAAVALSDDEDQAEEENASYDEESPLHPDLQRVRFGSKFRAAKLPKYSGDSDPGEFSRSYGLAIEASGGSRDTMAKCFPLALEGIALRWFWSLRHGTIRSWDQLRKKFVNNFQGTFVAPMSTRSLFQVKQQPGETLRQYSQRFAYTKAQIKGLSASSVIDAAREGVTHPGLLDKLHRKPISSVAQLMTYFEEYARSEEGQMRRQAMIVPVRATGAKTYEDSVHRDSRRGRKHLRGEVLSITPRVPAKHQHTSGGGRYSGAKAPSRALSGGATLYCSVHDENRSHDTDICRTILTLRNDYLERNADRGSTDRGNPVPRQKRSRWSGAAMSQRSYAWPQSSAGPRFPSSKTRRIGGNEWSSPYPLEPRQVHSVREGAEGTDPSGAGGRVPKGRPVKPLPEGEIMVKTLIQDGKERPIQFGGGLEPEVSKQLEDVIPNNLDIFAWSDEDIPGVDRSIIEH